MRLLLAWEGEAAGNFPLYFSLPCALRSMNPPIFGRLSPQPRFAVEPPAPQIAASASAAAAAAGPVPDFVCAPFGKTLLHPVTADKKSVLLSTKLADGRVIMQTQLLKPLAPLQLNPTSRKFGKMGRKHGCMGYECRFICAGNEVLSRSDRDVEVKKHGCHKGKGARCSCPRSGVGQYPGLCVHCAGDPKQRQKYKERMKIREMRLKKKA